MLAALALALLPPAVQEEPPPLDPHRVTVDVDSWIHMCAQLSYLAVARAPSTFAGGIRVDYEDEEVERVKAWLTERGPERLAREFQEILDRSHTANHPISSHLGGRRDKEVELFILAEGRRVDAWAPLAVPSFVRTDPDNVRGLELRYTYADGKWSLAEVPRVAYTLMDTVELPECGELPFLDLDEGPELLIRHFKQEEVPVGVRSWYAEREIPLPVSGPLVDMMNQDAKVLSAGGPFPQGARFNLAASKGLPAVHLIEVLRSLAKEQQQRVVVALRVMELRTYPILDAGAAPPPPGAGPLEPGAPGTETRRGWGHLPVHLAWGYEDQESAPKVPAGTKREGLSALFPQGVTQRVCIVPGAEATVQDVVTTAAALLREGAQEIHLPVFRPGEEPTGPRVNPPPPKVPAKDDF